MKRRLKWLLWIVAPVLALVAGAVFLLQSDWFMDRLVERAEREILRRTGGRAELHSLSFTSPPWRFEAGDFILHGTERDDQAPLLKIKKATLDLTILSLLGRSVRLDALKIEGPEIHVYVAPDGKTNLPQPAAPAGASPVELLLKAAIGKLEITGGKFEYDGRQIPLEIKADGFVLTLNYERATPRYQGAFQVKALDLGGAVKPAIEASLALEAQRVVLEKVRASWGRSRLDLEGAWTSWKEARAEVRFEGTVALADVPSSPLRDGMAQVKGTARLQPGAGYEVAGEVDGRGLAWRRAGIAVEDVRAAAEFRLTPGRLELAGASVEALGGGWTGTGRVTGWREFELEGAAENLLVERLQRFRPGPGVKWNGRVSGPVRVAGRFTREGVRGIKAAAQLQVAPEPGQIPIRGAVDFEWRQEEGQLDLGRSWLATPGARVNFAGTLGKRLEMGVHLTRVQDIAPVIGLFRAEGAPEIPVRLLSGGEVRFEGVVAGELNDARVDGRVTAHNLLLDGRRVDRGEAQVYIASDQVLIEDLVLERDRARVEGGLRLSLDQWRAGAESALSAHLKAGGLDLARLAAEGGSGQRIAGTLAGNVEINGTVEAPQGKLDFTVAGLEARGEKIAKAEGRLSYAAAGKRLEGSLAADGATLKFGGAYEHARGEFDRGTAELSFAAAGWNLARIEAVRELREGLAGAATAQGTIKLLLEPERWRLLALDGDLTVGSLASKGGALGTLRVQSRTDGRKLALRGQWEVRNNRYDAEAALELGGDYPLTGKMALPNTTLGFLRDLAVDEARAEPLPVQGTVAGEVEFAVPLAKMEAARARVRLARLQIRPRQTQLRDTGLEAADLTIRNNGDLSIEVTRKGAQVETAHLTARETDLALGGGVVFGAKPVLDLRASGSINLAVLSTFRPDLQASGNSVLNATLRGSADAPLLNGRLEIRNASFYLRNLPNGIDQANGVVLFDRDRANIQKLTGQTGGGTFGVTGFLGYRGGELSYRLQGDARRIRVRYPEGVSTTLDADLSLTGSSVRSLLAGTIAVTRSGFNPRTDLASLLAESARAGSPPAAQNEFLQGMQLDVRVRTAANAEIQTSYTRDVQMEADLRLRGSPAKPILLGRLKVNQGEVDFLGTRYNISRGEIIFYNVTSLEPAVDLDLETRIRGVTVSVNFAGPMNKLNLSYRSDPPLQSSEILALLAVGRTPEGSRTSLGTSQTVGSMNTMTGGSSAALLGGALSASVNGRLERFFGASRIKIDPQITGVDNIPQARLTIEQQVSRNITLTFVTNLNRSQQQIVRMEWDLSREWSVVAVRDENGLFGVDFFLRKSLK